MSTRREFVVRAAATGVLGAATAPFERIMTKGSIETRIGTSKIPNTDLVVSRIAYGCGSLVPYNREPLHSDDIAKAATLINTAYDNGITLFDLGDMYGFGKSETAFGEVLHQSPGLRGKLVIQSKCGFVQSQLYDCSYEHIVHSAEGSLRRLNTDRLDILLLHVSDALVEPEEVAAAFDELKRSGKVLQFGVSNHLASEIELLRKYVRQSLVVNQVPLGLGQAAGIADGTTLNYCRQHDIQVQAYSPLRGNLFDPPADATPETKDLARELSSLASEKNASPAAVALAWLLRHPAGIVPVIGATKPEHVIEDCAAGRLTMSRSEWYALYGAAAKMQHLALL